MADSYQSRARGDGRIRILHVLDTLNVGGTELNAVRTAERLDRHRFDLRLACLDARGPLRQRLDSASIPVVELGGARIVSVAALRRGWRFREMVRRERIDVIHAHDPYSNTLAVPWGRASGTPVIASHRWWRDVHPRKVQIANRAAYRVADRVLANSRSVGELVVNEEGVPRSRLSVIPNFVDSSAFEPLTEQRRLALRSRLGLSPDEISVGVVANLYPVKDHATLVRAAARLSGSWPAVRFVFVGEGREREPLAAQAASAGIARQVLMPGQIVDEPGLAGVFDVFVLPSREEGFPNAVVEAMAAGRAVVATNVGGIPDAVIQFETGLLVAVGDDQGMADAIDRLLRDAAMRRRLGTAGATRAREEFHEDVVMTALSNLYMELLNR